MKQKHTRNGWKTLWNSNLFSRVTSKLLHAFWAWTLYKGFQVSVRQLRGKKACWFCYIYFSLSIYVKFILWYTISNNEITLEIILTEISVLFSEVMFQENKQKVSQMCLVHVSVLLNAVPDWLIWYLRCFLCCSLHHLELLAYTEFT